MFAIVAKLGYTTCMKVKKTVKNKGGNPNFVKGKAQPASRGPRMSSVLKHDGGVMLKRGEWEKNRPAHVQSMRDKHTAKTDKKGHRVDVDEEFKNAIIVRRSEGATQAEIAAEFDVPEKEIALVMAHKFVDGKTGKQKLRDLLLSNSIQLAAQTRTKASDMTGMQSAVATGIMVTKFVELDKHLQNTPPETDNESLSEIANELKGLNDLVRDAGLSDAAPLIDDVDEEED